MEYRVKKSPILREGMKSQTSLTFESSSKRGDSLERQSSNGLSNQDGIGIALSRCILYTSGVLSIIIVCFKSQPKVSRSLRKGFLVQCCQYNL